MDDSCISLWIVRYLIPGITVENKDAIPISMLKNNMLHTYCTSPKMEGFLDYYLYDYLSYNNQTECVTLDRVLYFFINNNNVQYEELKNNDKYELTRSKK